MGRSDTMRCYVRTQSLLESFEGTGEYSRDFWLRFYDLLNAVSW